MTWEIFMKGFRDQFFHKEMREANVMDFILKFTKFSKYNPSLVSDPRDEINHFMIGVSDVCNINVISLCYMAT